MSRVATAAVIAAGLVTGLAAVAVAMTAALRARLVIATVRGRSMSPTFADGERVLAVRRRRYAVGDVVVFRTPRHRTTEDDLAWRIKRVVAIAGDANPWPSDGQVGEQRCGCALAPVVPPDHVAVAGDGIRSEDSRQLGFVPLADIAGHVVPARPFTASAGDPPPAPRPAGGEQPRAVERDGGGVGPS